MLKTLNVVLAENGKPLPNKLDPKATIKRPLHVTKTGGFAVNFHKQMIAVEPINATTVNILRGNVVKDTRPANFTDIGRETKATREAKAASQPVKKAARINSVDKAKKAKAAAAPQQDAKANKLEELAARYNVTPEKLALMLELISAA